MREVGSETKVLSRRERKELRKFALFLIGRRGGRLWSDLTPLRHHPPLCLWARAPMHPGWSVYVTGLRFAREWEPGFPALLSAL